MGLCPWVAISFPKPKGNNREKSNRSNRASFAGTLGNRRSIKGGRDLARQCAIDPVVGRSARDHNPGNLSKNRRPCRLVTRIQRATARYFCVQRCALFGNKRPSRHEVMARYVSRYLESATRGKLLSPYLGDLAAARVHECSYSSILLAREIVKAKMKKSKAVRRALEEIEMMAKTIDVDRAAA